MEPTILLNETNKGLKSSDISKLKEYFDADCLEWLPKNCTKTKSGEYRVLVIPYMNRRAVMDRLDDVCGAENWQDEYLPGPNGGVMCKLSIRIDGEWITKCDGAENTNIESIKGGISDAFKRAATKWGIGRYLAQLPKIFGIVHSGGSEWTKYTKGGAAEYVNYDIPPIPPMWLPKNSKSNSQIPKEAPEDVQKKEKEARDKVLSILEADQKGDKLLGQDYIDRWTPRAINNKFPAGGAVKFLSELCNYMDQVKAREN